MSAVDQSAFGPFFTVQTHVAGEEPAPPWRFLSELADGSGALRDRIEAVRRNLAGRVAKSPDGVDLRVAASVTHLGVIARVIAPTIAAVVTGGPRISQKLNDVWWQDQLGGPFPLSVLQQQASEREGGDNGLGSAVESVTRCVLDETGVSDRVLWGNVGSSANSAARLIGAARPDLSEAAHEAANSYLRDVRVDGGALRAGPGFRRRSCCLIYQLTDDRSAVCGDCVLEPTPD